MALEGRTHLDCEEASEFITPRKQTPFPRVKAGIALTAIGGVLCLAATYATGTYPFQQDPWARFHLAQSKLLEAFNSRALSEGPTGFTTSVEVVAKEEGAEDPDAMSMKVRMAKAVAAPKWPALVMTLEAKKNKEDDLKARCETIWGAIKGHMCSGAGKHKDDCHKAAPPLKISADTKSAHFKNGNWVHLELPMPHGHTGKAEEKDLEAAFKGDAGPDISGKVSFGRTIHEIFQNPKDNVAVLPNGIKAKMSATFASIAFETMKEKGMLDPKSVKMMEGLASLQGRLALEYKKGGDAFDGLPHMKDEMQQAKMMLKHQPEDITKHLVGLEDLMVGIKGVVASGLPHADKEIIMKFENFHPGPLFTEILDKR